MATIRMGLLARAFVLCCMLLFVAPAASTQDVRIHVVDGAQHFDAGDAYHQDTGNVKLGGGAEIEPAADPIVETTKGLVKGLHLVRENYTVDRFFGIPYAKPPVGTLRFQPPQPHDGWEGILSCDDTSSAEQLLKVCPQRNLRGNGNIGREDCLYLNLWVPGGVNETRDHSLPVMLWIYGGGFNIGTSTGLTFFYDMERMVAQGKVIGITFNYRLNSLGFLSTGDEAIPGNNGVFDHIAAMQWVQDNVRNFGGDPDQVTIFGESAGAVAVSYHMMSPVSEDLFLRGISESGTAPSTWTYERDPLSQAQTVAEKLGCPTDNTKLLAGCLRDRPLTDLIVASIGISWNIVIDGYFLPGNPENMLANSANKDYLMGYNSMEGHGMMSAAFPQINLPLPMSRDDVREAARILSADEPPQVAEAVAFKYIQWDEPETDTLWPKLAITDMGTDWVFSAGTYINADERLKSVGSGRTFIYVFSEKSRIRIFPDWTESNHMREMWYTFGHPFEAKRFNDSDRVLSLAMMTYWTNFARSGSPNHPNVDDILTEWPEYTLDTKYTFELNTTTVDDPEQYKLENYRGDYYHMWAGIRDSMWNLPLTTCPTTEETTTSKLYRRKAFGRENLDAVQARNITCPNQPLVRKTATGCVEGYENEWNGQVVERYLGIPFGESPTGASRFSEPLPASGWEGTRPAKTYSKICPQTPAYDDTTMDEDCLHLCVYVPKTSDGETLAVMIWFFGEGYQNGDGMESSSADGLAAQGKVIVVTPNYRVGSFGFMSTDDDASPGNYGLLDQQLAMKWVKENIETFGGDPDKIAIFGHSAGAQSVYLHTVSPTNEGLGIDRAIMESAEKLPSDMNQLENTIRLAEAASCDVSSGNDVIVDCLRGLTTSELVEAQDQAQVRFQPTVDGYFLPDYPRNLADERVLNWKYLLGSNDGDGSARWPSIQGVHNEDEYNKYVNGTYERDYGWRTNSIREEYGNYNDIHFFEDDQKIQRRLIELAGDEEYTTPACFIAGNYSAIGSDVYMYYFTYADSVGTFPSWGGAAHGAELPYVFGHVLTDESKSGPEKALSERMIAYWSNFAKTGDPNEGSPGPLDRWNKYKERLSSGNYMTLDVEVLNGGAQDLRPTENGFWGDYMVRQSAYCEDNTIPVTTEAPEVPVQGDPQVETTLGVINGRKVKTPLYEVDAFIGIPYASPPLDQLRFAKPAPMQKWSEPLEATSPKPPCIQIRPSGEVIGSEDCLYLDVYAPSGVIGTTSSAVMPVMVWIHGDADGESLEELGGSFWGGGGHPGWDGSYTTTDPAYLSHFGNVVIVRPNFRLGPMGFLTTEDGDLPGNYALWDLLEVVNWVEANAEHFGGDRKKITLFGHGSGAAAAEILVSSAQLRAKVKRVISQSGSAFSPWALCPPSGSCSSTADSVAASVGCETSDLVACLRGVPAEDIVRSNPMVPFDHTKSDSAFNAWGTWRMRVDGELITYSNLRTGLLTTTPDLDYMSGTTNHEFYRYLKATYPDSFPGATDGSNTLTKAIGNTRRFLFGNSIDLWPEQLYTTLAHTYTPWDNRTDAAKLSQSASKYYADLLFATGSSRGLDALKDSDGHVYQYVLTRGLRASTESELPSWMGARHGDDLAYVFGVPFTSPDEYTDDDRAFSVKMMSYWINFAWFGDPNNALADQKWREYSSDSKYYLNIHDGRNILELRTVDYNIEKNSLWHEVVPDFAPAVLPTTTTKTQQTTSTEPVPRQTCNVPSMGSGLGLNLAPEEADSAIYAMFSVCLVLGISLVGLLALLCARGKPTKATDEVGVIENGKAINTNGNAVPKSLHSVTGL